MVHVYKATLKNRYLTIFFIEYSIDGEFIFFNSFFFHRLIHIHLNRRHYSSPPYRDHLHLLSLFRHGDTFTDPPSLFFPTINVKHHGYNPDAIISISFARFKNENKVWKQKHDYETENQWVKRRRKINEKVGVSTHRVRLNICLLFTIIGCPSCEKKSIPE